MATGSHGWAALMLPGDVLSTGIPDRPDALQRRLDWIGYAIAKGLADPKAHEWVDRATQHCPHSNMPGAAECEIQAIFQALKRSFKYRYHPRGIDQIRTLTASLRHKTADCDQAFVCLATALHIRGFLTSGMVMSADGDTIGHVWGAVGYPRNNPRTWIDLELTTGPVTPEHPLGGPDAAVVGYAVPQAARRWQQRFVFKLG